MHARAMFRLSSKPEWCRPSTRRPSMSSIWRKLLILALHIMATARSHTARQFLAHTPVTTRREKKQTSVLFELGHERLDVDPLSHLGRDSDATQLCLRRHHGLKVPVATNHERRA